MKETYVIGALKIERNFNKRGGKFFYVIWKHKDWIGKILFNKKKNSWIIEFEDEIPFKKLTKIDYQNTNIAKDMIIEDYK